MVENRRVMMTKRLLKESIFELMKKKPLNKITIKELCENADVNRTTFYKYYGDQYSLVKEAEDELLEKTSEFLKNLSLEKEKIKLLEEFDILLSKNSDTDFRIRLMSVAMKKVMAEKYEPNIKEGDKKYVYCMIIMGAISTISLWIKSNYDKSVEDVANLMYNLVLYGLKGIEEEKNMSV